MGTGGWHWWHRWVALIGGTSGWHCWAQVCGTSGRHWWALLGTALLGGTGEHCWTQVVALLGTGGCAAGQKLVGGTAGHRSSWH
ncbi:unnamed protein product [Staurois parvus]|uniref:Secreted protein n=1 Tax=Staurois parvus TaxID=386267 RepID=A0ABN9FX04_9NEOB|nr:unnamed protein product [Staurois parvus]